MKLKRNLIYILSILFLLLLTAQFSHAVSIPESPGKHVVDLADIIDHPIKIKLNQYLRELQLKTTAQIAILTIKSLEGGSIEDLSITVAHDKWKLGQKGKDNGILLLVSLNDRKYRIEVGYGLEGVIPDSLAGSIGRNYLVPFFRKGDYSTGIYTAAVALANEIAKDSGVTISGMPQPGKTFQRTKEDQPTGFFGKIVSVIFFVILFILFIRNPRLFLMLLLFSSIGGRRGGWGGGGGFGGSGGFGGGGGGFGGGGASGGW
ncbi:MAG: TPM domain-containing protein [Thermodesulfobacteriota bacterium]|nr:TPM domain-containing protein [Thermodesulfobacteriota bacterium]